MQPSDVHREAGGHEAEHRRRGRPKRPTSVPKSGAPSPNRMMLTATASEMLARLQPNSASSGLMRTWGAVRTPAAASNTRPVTSATTHA